MALEAAGERDAALDEYDEAIEQQRVAYDRAPQVAEYREFLSKHYYNYGRGVARRRATRPGAAEAALARRKLVAGDGEPPGAGGGRAGPDSRPVAATGNRQATRRRSRTRRRWPS